MSPVPSIRVLHIASGDLWAGAEAQVCTLLTALRRRADVEVAAAILNPGELVERLRGADIRCDVLDERTLPAWRIAAGMRACMAEFRPHVVHTHRQKENVLGATMAMSLGIRSVRTTHGAEEHPVTWRQVPKWLARKLDAGIAAHLQSRVIAVSDELAGKLRRQLPKAHIEVIDNTVDLADIEARSAGHPPRPTAPPWRIGIVGRLVPVKRVDLLLEVAATLERRQPGAFEFVVLGDGPLEQALQARARELAVRARFTGFMANPLPEIAAFSALAITSDHEGLPTVALEALALHVPVVTRAIGGLPALAAAGGDCTLVHGTDDAAITGALADAIAACVVRAGPAQGLPLRYQSNEGAERHMRLYRAILGE